MEALSSRKNQYIQMLRMLATDTETRMNQGVFVCEGAKALSEALRFGAEIVSVLWKKTPGDIVLGPEIIQYVATEDLFEYVCPLKNSRGPVFTVRLPDISTIPPANNAIVLENVQDPGNVGTIIRSANAFGIDVVILTGNCADAYNFKTVRATMGAVFRQNIVNLDRRELHNFIESNNMKLFGAALHRDSVDIRCADLSHAAIAIGSEGNGLSDEMLGMCDGTLIIPMNPQSESLNAGVAASVAMWEIARSRL